MSFAAKNPFEEAYLRLFDYFGEQHWWPAETPFEVLVGAVLVQNTNWSNAGKALDNLRESGLLEYETLSQLSAEEIAPLIRPSGYYNVKAKRLRNLLNLIEEEYAGDFASFCAAEGEVLREQLLAVKGIGAETADSILLYACALPYFVVDAYTHRVFSRHNLLDEESDYVAIQGRFVAAIECDVDLYNEYHALIVRVAKEFCRKGVPLCAGCPLEDLTG